MKWDVPLLESIVLWCKERARRITRNRESLAPNLNLNTGYLASSACSHVRISCKVLDHNRNKGRLCLTLPFLASIFCIPVSKCRLPRAQAKAETAAMKQDGRVEER